MTPDIALSLEPLVLVHDRYRGVYSGGEWLAVANADLLIEQHARASWLLDNGPFSDDISAVIFWESAPSWIASGPTPSAAIANLIQGRLDPSFSN